MTWNRERVVRRRRRSRAGAYRLTAVSGVRLALARGRGTTAVPIGGTLVGAIASVAVVAVALTFTASMDHLLSTPRLYGQNWDYRTNFIAPSPAHGPGGPGDQRRRRGQR